MKSKAPLVMMEQMVMLLVFALAAALCLQAFVQSDAQSKRGEARDRAIIAAQSAAEAIRSCGGDMEAAGELLGASSGDDTSFMLDYDSGWVPNTGTVRYTLGAVLVESGQSGLGKASVWVRDESVLTENAELFRIEICWQEEVAS